MVNPSLYDGVYLEYAHLLRMPWLIGERTDGSDIRLREGGLLIPYTLTEEELEALLKAEGVGYDYPANHCYRVHTRLFGLNMRFTVSFWFQDGKHNSVHIESAEKADWAHFRQVQKALRRMLGAPLNKAYAGALGFLLGSEGAGAEWYEKGVSIEHDLDKFMGRMRHGIRIRDLG